MPFSSAMDGRKSAKNASGGRVDSAVVSRLLAVLTVWERVLWWRLFAINGRDSISLCLRLVPVRVLLHLLHAFAWRAGSSLPAAAYCRYRACLPLLYAYLSVYCLLPRRFSPPPLKITQDRLFKTSNTMPGGWQQTACFRWAADGLRRRRRMPSVPTTLHFPYPASLHVHACYLPLFFAPHHRRTGTAETAELAGLEPPCAALRALALRHAASFR